MAGKTVVIVGGGIAGTTCAEYVSALSPETNVVLIASTDVIKTAATTAKISRLLNELNVKETKTQVFEDQFPNVSVQVGVVTAVDTREKHVLTSEGVKVSYDKLCICTGAKPNLIGQGMSHVITIRDTDTVEHLQSRLKQAKKVVVVGNGGIALELVYEVIGCEVVWCIRDDYIGTKYLDHGASTFLLPSLEEGLKDDHGNERKADQVVFKRKKYETERDHLSKIHGVEANVGSALGPDWCSQRQLQVSVESPTKRSVEVKYRTTIDKMSMPAEQCCKEEVDRNHNVYVHLSNGEVVGADLVICATGVTPNTDLTFSSDSPIRLSDQGGICVDENMRTNLDDIYAAGDVCEPCWEHAQHWFPMKLWTQGWQMGAFAGKCIVEHLNASTLPLDFCFELFTHVTTFFGYKICLLGCYNAQKLEKDSFEFLVRYTKGMEYIKLVMANGRVQGGVLIGETDLEETMENLILNQIDVGFLGESLLDPDVDIEDYFD